MQGGLEFGQKRAWGQLLQPRRDGERARTRVPGPDLVSGCRKDRQLDIMALVTPSLLQDSFVLHSSCAAPARKEAVSINWGGGPFEGILTTRARLVCIRAPDFWKLP